MTEEEVIPKKPRAPRKKKTDVIPEFVSSNEIKLDKEEFQIPKNILMLFKDINEFDITIDCYQWEIKAHLKIKE
jgi:hypothetical protein